MHVGPAALKPLKMIVSLVATRGGRRYPRCVAFYDVVAAFVPASIDEVVVVLPPDDLLGCDEYFLLLKALRGIGNTTARECSCEFSCVRNLPPPRPCWNVDATETTSRLKIKVTCWREAKLLRRVGRGHLPEIKFLKRTVHFARRRGLLQLERRRPLRRRTG